MCRYFQVNADIEQPQQTLSNKKGEVSDCSADVACSIFFGRKKQQAQRGLPCGHSEARSFITIAGVDYNVDGVITTITRRVTRVVLLIRRKLS